MNLSAESEPDNNIKLYKHIDKIIENHYNKLWDSTDAWVLFNVEPELVAFIAQKKYGVNRVVRGIHLLERSVKYVNERVFRKLLQFGSNPNTEIGIINRTTILSYLTQHSSEISKIKLLVEYGANPDLRDVNGNTSLHSAVIGHNFEALKIFLENNANCFIKNNKNETVFDLAAAYKNERIIKILSDYKIAIKKRTILLLTLAHNFDEDSLVGNYYLPLDMLKIIIMFVKHEK